MSISSDEKRLFFLIDQAHSRLFKEANRQLKAMMGISVAQSTALFLLARQDEMTLGDLANGLSLRQSAITGLVGRMEKKQLLSRRADQRDARIIRVSITEQGRQALASAKQMTQAFNQQISEEFDASELQAVRRFLARIARGFPFTEQQISNGVSPHDRTGTNSG